MRSVTVGLSVGSVPAVPANDGWSLLVADPSVGWVRVTAGAGGCEVVLVDVVEVDVLDEDVLDEDEVDDVELLVWVLLVEVDEDDVVGVELVVCVPLAELELDVVVGVVLVVGGGVLDLLAVLCVEEVDGSGLADVGLAELDDVPSGVLVLVIVWVPWPGAVDGAGPTIQLAWAGDGSTFPERATART